MGDVDDASRARRRRIWRGRASVVPPASSMAPGWRPRGAASSTRAGAGIGEIPHDASPPRACAHRRDDMRIGAAAAEIARHVFADLVVGAGMAFADAGDRRHDLARRAIAALEGVLVEEGRLHRMQRAVRRASPSMVVIARPSTWAASVRQASTRSPSTCTVQAPHWPWSQPFLVPVRPRCSRRASSSVTRGSTASSCAVPLTSRSSVWFVIAVWSLDEVRSLTLAASERRRSTLSRSLEDRDDSSRTGKSASRPI